MSYLNDSRVLFAAECRRLAWNRTAVALADIGALTSGGSSGMFRK